MDIDFCHRLTKNLTRIPRKLEILNVFKEGAPTYFLRFDPNKKNFTTNISWIPGEFLPDRLNSDQVELIENSFGRPLINYLSNFVNTYKSLPKDFWIN